VSEITTQFRSSFNGYNREDVVDFIDRMTQAHEDALDRLQKANAKLKEELAEANEALAAAKKSSGSENALSEAQALVADLRMLNENLEDRNQKLEEELSKLRAEREVEQIPMTIAHEEAMDRLQKENLMLRTELEDANDALNALKNNKSVESSTFSEARDAITELRSNNEQLRKQVRSLEDELEQLRAEQKLAVSSVSNDKDAEIERLQDANKELQQELTATNEAFIAANESLTAANEALADARAHAVSDEAISEARATIAELADHKEALEKRIYGMEEELKQLRADREAEAATASRERAEEIERLQNGNAALRQELEIRIQSLETELEQVCTERDAGAALLAQAQEQLIAQNTSKESANSVSAKSTTDYAELELAAYRRAERTERLARDRARDVYRQVQTVFGQANETMEGCHGDLAQLCEVLTANVNELQTVLTKLNSTYQETEKTFAEIGARDHELMEESI